MTPAVTTPMEMHVATAVAERLRAYAVGHPDGYAEGGVYDALAIAAFRDARPRQSPCAVVLPVAEDARPPVAPGAPPATAAIQAATGTISVHTLLRIPGDAYGHAPSGLRLATLVGRARGLIAGWRPREGGGDDGQLIDRVVREGLAFDRGSLAELADGWLEWVDEFSIRWWVHPRPPRERE